MTYLLVLIFHKISVILTLTGRCITVDGHVASAQVSRSPSTKHSNIKFLFFTFLGFLLLLLFFFFFFFFLTSH